MQHDAAGVRQSDEDPEDPRIHRSATCADDVRRGETEAAGPGESEHGHLADAAWATLAFAGTTTQSTDRALSLNGADAFGWEALAAYASRRRRFGRR